MNNRTLRRPSTLRGRHLILSKAQENQQQFDQNPFSRRFGDADTTEFQEIDATLRTPDTAC